MEPVAKEEVLLLIAADDPLKPAKATRVETMRGMFAGSRFDRQDEGISVGAP
jgi:hypothetical protein